MVAVSGAEVGMLDRSSISGLTVGPVVGEMPPVLAVKRNVQIVGLTRSLVVLFTEAVSFSAVYFD